MSEFLSLHCPYCGEVIELAIDEGGGSAQSYVEDCPVCCRPNVLRVSIDDEGVVHVTARAE